MLGKFMTPYEKKKDVCSTSVHIYEQKQYTSYMYYNTVITVLVIDQEVISITKLHNAEI
jgi:hypothetical protein